MRLCFVFVLIGCCLSAAGPPIETPFDFLHNQILLRAAINGNGPYNFVLDSGTYASTIDLRLAKQLGLPLAASRSEGKGAGGGRVFSRQTFCDELAVGGLTIKGFAAVAMDLSELSTQMGRPLHGVLGYSFLSSRITQIDYFHRRIRFDVAPSREGTDTPRRISFPLLFRAKSILPVLEECFVNGIRVPLTLDTGSSLGLILFPRAVRYLGLEKLAREGIPMEAAGYGGKARLTKGWTRSVKLKSIDLGAIEVAFARSGYGEDEDLARRAGNLGNAVLQDFVLTLDYPNHVVVLEAADQ